MVAPKALEKVPGAQGVHCKARVVLEKVPLGQGMHVEGAAAPTKVLYIPAAHTEQVELEEAPVADDQVPAGQGVGFTEESGQ